MTAIEIAIVVLNLVLLVPGSRRVRLELSLVTLVIAGIEILLARHRWQMVPSYAFALVAFAIVAYGSLRRPAATPPLRITHVLLKVAAALVWLVTAAVPFLFPLFFLPAPTGRFAVGTAVWFLADKSRAEIYTPQLGDVRRLAAQIWYPARVSGSDATTPYKPLADAEGAAMSRLFGLPPFLLSHLRLVETHSYLDAPLAGDSDRFPVIVFSHGHAFFGTRTQNTSLMEELASHGYVVVAIDHPYECTVTTLEPGGEVVPADAVLVKDIQRSRKGGPQRQQVLETIASSSNADEVSKAYGELKQLNGLYERSAAIWQRDVRFVLDEIQRLGESEGRWKRRLDLDNVGVIGMSLGGAAAGLASSLDRRIKAGINMDGFQYGDAYTAGVRQPFMFMYSSQNAGMNRFMYKRMFGDTYTLLLDGTQHSDFSEFAFMSPLLSRLFTGYALDPYTGHAIIRAYAVLFFDRYLKMRPGAEDEMRALGVRHREARLERIDRSVP